MSPAGRRTSWTIQRERNRRIARRRLFAAAAVVLVLVAGLFIRQSTKGNPRGVSSNSTSAKQIGSTVKPAPPPNVEDTGLNQLISTWATQYSFNSSVYVAELTGDTPHLASYHATTSVIPASTYKIYVAYAVLHGIEQGKYALTTKTDDGKSIQTDLQNMILNSDNDAARTLGFLYGWKNINALLQSQGLTDTDVYNYVPPSTLPQGDKRTTARDLATILEKLYDGKLLNTSNTELLLGLLKTQHYRERIPSGVPNGVVVADKPGWLSPNENTAGVYVQNDAGIVYGPKSTYILVVTTSKNESTAPLAKLSKQIYDYLEQ